MATVRRKSFSGCLIFLLELVLPFILWIKPRTTVFFKFVEQTLELVVSRENTIPFARIETENIEHYRTLQDGTQWLY